MTEYEKLQALDEMKIKLLGNFDTLTGAIDDVNAALKVEFSTLPTKNGEARIAELRRVRNRSLKLLIELHEALNAVERTQREIIIEYYESAL